MCHKCIFLSKKKYEIIYSVLITFCRLIGKKATKKWMSMKINSYVLVSEIYKYNIVVSAQMLKLVWIPWVMYSNGGKNSNFFTKSFNAERNANKSIPLSQILAVWKSAGSKKYLHTIGNNAASQELLSRE